MKILKQFIKEFWIPTLGALIWTYINYKNNSDTTQLLINNAKNFGAAFFLTSWFGGQLFRIIKQQKTESNFSSVLSRLEKVSKNLETGLKDFKGYTTGGDSFCYLDIKRTNDGKYLNGLVHSGKYPLYNIEVALHNLNDESHSDILNRPRDKFDDLAPGLVHFIQEDDDEVIKFDDNDDNYIKYTATFYCRKGSFVQDIRIIKFEDEWHSAIRVRNGEETIFTKIPDKYPLKEPFD